MLLPERGSPSPMHQATYRRSPSYVQIYSAAMLPPSSSPVQASHSLRPEYHPDEARKYSFRNCSSQHIQTLQAEKPSQQQQQQHHQPQSQQQLQQQKRRRRTMRDLTTRPTTGLLLPSRLSSVLTRSSLEVAEGFRGNQRTRTAKTEWRDVWKWRRKCRLNRNIYVDRGDMSESGNCSGHSGHLQLTSVQAQQNWESKNWKLVM
mmetsp:Transcript_33497/g.72484  ORF Transcript_33497/g.72484 Transcript_33497/m.72484 type:complete len:204 (+) Transcript_33497:1973-2584(+)